MSPYTIARDHYHAHGEPWVAWDSAEAFHLQHGLVISSARAFIMARSIPVGLDPHFHPQLIAYPGAANDWCHVWSYAGDLSAFIPFALELGITHLTFQRRHVSRIHILPVERLFNVPPTIGEH